MCAKRSAEHFRAEQTTSTSKKPSFSYCSQTLCEYAQAFRDPLNRHFDMEMAQYLIGPLNINHISRSMYHNNINHQCTTVEQIGRLVVLMDSRKMYGEEYNTSEVLRKVSEAVEKIEHYYSSRGIVPEVTCLNPH
ncbi:Protein CBG27958 [Caenorhabditis briggsae]|uniref:Uncharacterized protein n=2 Tax=Caenorhabditis briggsae TaxID=6238 RepID=A0AAE9FGG5_CAEBR|nr:Protein CBG27958 [Caenorhabditis briggsae]ULT83822.1 hypothetical protein L3Y34_012834 [Caenorhabditis briggsae]UMM43074.1 hypothetical protein L5515_018682 [Caenorhabditis briggsae]CAS00130.1 Protein CBG27958 [Caenorhabditis briggsae]